MTILVYYQFSYLVEEKDTEQANKIQQAAPGRRGPGAACRYITILIER
ncbi:MAG: hypothetical protein ABI824_01775 [Acidobacteriota bacterium]